MKHVYKLKFEEREQSFMKCRADDWDEAKSKFAEMGSMEEEEIDEAIEQGICDFQIIGKDLVT